MLVYQDGSSPWLSDAVILSLDPGLESIQAFFVMAPSIHPYNPHVVAARVYCTNIGCCGHCVYYKLYCSMVENKLSECVVAAANQIKGRLPVEHIYSCCGMNNI
jgi:hypothetical protein